MLPNEEHLLSKEETKRSKSVSVSARSPVRQRSQSWYEPIDVVKKQKRVK